jgi:hypothetical protein
MDKGIPGNLLTTDNYFYRRLSKILSFPPGLGRGFLPQDKINGPTRRCYFLIIGMDKGIPDNL